MNKARRKSLEHTHAKIEDLRATLYNLAEDLGNEKDAERESFGNMSEGLQQSENGQRIEQAADALDEAYDFVDEALSGMQECMDKISEAVDL